MKQFLSIVHATFRYRWRALATILFNLLFVVFNLLSLVLFVPFLQVIFPTGEQERVTEPLLKGEGVEKDFSKKAIKLLQEYDWTGNIRELRNVIERLIILGGKEISEQDVKLFASK